jgi:dihydroflavonol-4-reductase
VRRAVAGAACVFHLAGNPNLWDRDKSSFLAVNTEGTRNVIEAAERAGVERIVHTSTESILKSVRRDAPVPITGVEAALDPADMPGPDAGSKLLGERVAMEAAGSGVPVVVVNPTMPLGPGDRRLTPPTRMLLGFLNGETPAYLDCVFNVVDVRHAALGHILAAEKGRIGERYVLGGANVSMSELLAELGRITELAMPRFRVPYAAAYAFAAICEIVADRVTQSPPVAPLTGVRLARTPMIFDSSRAHDELGLPVTSLLHTLTDAIVWLAEQGHVRRALPRRFAAAV